MNATIFIILIVGLSVTGITTFTYYWYYLVNESHSNPLGYTNEQSECFKYGGSWGTAKNGTEYCNKGTGIAVIEGAIPSCPEGYLRVENSYPASRYDGAYSCHKEQHVINAKCEKYWEIEWANFGYSCSKLNQEEINSLKLDEILENQKKILELLKEE